MIRDISKDLKLFYSPQFPAYFMKNSSKKRAVTIGVGGNVGDVLKRFEKLINIINRDKRVDLIATSAILRNPPFGILEQNVFYNTIIIIKTDMNPKEILRYLLHLEKKFGRIRELKNGPRTLDLDIIFIDELVISNRDLQVPHPHWNQRDSVLIPLEIISKVVTI